MMNYWKSLFSRTGNQQTDVHLFFPHLNFREIELKEKFIESWENYHSNLWKEETDLAWEIQPEAVLKCNLRIYVSWVPQGKDKYFHLFFPDLFRKEKEKSLRSHILGFLEDRTEKETFPKTNFFSQLTNIPKYFHWKKLTLQEGELDLPEDWIWTKEGFSPLVFQNKIQVKVRIGRLEKIFYRWKHRKFYSPSPLVGELYVKCKRKYAEGSYGETLFLFLGYFLENPKDHYFLEYWNLTPILDPNITLRIPKELWNHNRSGKERSPIYWIEDLKFGYENTFESRPVYRGATSSLDRPK
ncbi:hypothetical protein [Leptospira idonii]|uniref:Uncharacterized protein n=1 Tax=Leptospira idonii TaxID=1193500 RepID=A0A4R9LZX7_9LEPT|nr:hypothetical protein [Leptospira idonii]TGN19943.1 hypothetical protein EHS15_06075 [Leptospira idonii]